MKIVIVGSGMMGSAIASGELKAEDFPLLLHTDEILTEKRPVDIPWESFTFEA